jgi:hypothetical protein
MVMQRGQKVTRHRSADVGDHALDRRPLPLRTAEGEESSFDGNQRLARCAHRVKRQESNGGGAVDEAAVEAIADHLEQALQPAILVGKLVQSAAGRLERGKHYCAGRKIEVARNFPDERCGIKSVGMVGQQGIADGVFDSRFGDAEAGGTVGLRVHVDQQGSQAPFGVDCSEVDGGGCLATAALLIDDRDRAHGVLFTPGPANVRIIHGAQFRRS